MKKSKALALIMCLIMLASTAIMPVCAEEVEEDWSQYEIEDDFVDVNDESIPDEVVVKGTIAFPHLSHYTGEALYTGRVVRDCGLRAEMLIDSTKLIGVPENGTIDILDIEPDWVLARYKDKVGYLKRTWIEGRPAAVNPETTPPYGVYKYNYIGVCKEDTPIQKAPGDGQEAYLTLTKGARIAIIDIYEGWGRFYYHHQYGYVDLKHLTDFQTVSPTDEEMGYETPIAAYTSYYKITTNEANIGRMKNLVVASDRISRVYEPGEEYNCNKQMGPYSLRNGYFKAPVLVNGETIIGSGGGTCQVSSTLFNVLLQLPGLTVVYRRPHQQSGASYLPVGNDAAVGTDRQNLIFRNDYDFPVRLEATVQDGALTMVMYRAH